MKTCHDECKNKSISISKILNITFRKKDIIYTEKARVA